MGSLSFSGEGKGGRLLLEGGQLILTSGWCWGIQRGS